MAEGFDGPRLSGNGGYVGGLMAGRFTEKFGGDGAVEVTLRAPIPIDRKLQLAHGDEALMLRDGETLLCEARAGSVAHLSPPPPPTDWNDVMRRGEAGGAPDDSEFSHCIVCGREPGVGERLRAVGTREPPTGSCPPCSLRPPTPAHRI